MGRGVDEFQLVQQGTGSLRWKRFVQQASVANLKLEEAQPQMFERTAYAMAGFF